MLNTTNTLLDDVALKLSVSEQALWYRFVIHARSGDSRQTVRQNVIGALSIPLYDQDRLDAIQTENLFPGRHNGSLQRLRDYFVLRLRLDDPTLREADLFDIAYALRDHCGFTRVSPDVAVPTFYAAFAGSSDPVDDDQAHMQPDWSLCNMGVDRIRDLVPPPGGALDGEGVLIGHPDTGWASHDNVNPGCYDLERAINLLTGSSDARDPLHTALQHLVFPGHGTATSSITSSLRPTDDDSQHRIDEPDNQIRSGWQRIVFQIVIMIWQALNSLFRVYTPQKSPTPTVQIQQTQATRPIAQAVAPKARIIPIRCTDTVMISSGLNLARAIYYAAEQGAGVITISLGGLHTPWLQAAVSAAVHDYNCIVIASAGQPHPMVAAPSIYNDCIGVAASNVHNQPWSQTSRGAHIDISAPGENVWRATYDRANNMHPVLRHGSGTSFSAANLAGVAALWLAFHGRDRLLRGYAGKVPLQRVFKHLLQATATTPPGWDSSQYGAGIVNAAALLDAPLPAPDSIATAATAEPDDITRQLLHRLIAPDETPEAGTETIRRYLESIYHTPIADPTDLIQNFEEELLLHIYQQKQPIAHASYHPVISTGLRAALG